MCDQSDEKSFSCDSSALVAWLRDPKNHGEHLESIDCIETHISWVFLTQEYAYKLKKPVAFDYLDFRTLDSRRAACEDEVRLNRRLAPGIYIGVVGVTQPSSDQFQFGGAGPIVDWLVKMKRLNDASRCDNLLRAGSLGSDQLGRLVDHLVTFYRTAPSPPISGKEYIREVKKHIRSNRGELLEMSDDDIKPLIKRIHANQLLFVHTQEDEFIKRVEAGCVIEGHGDLRPEHVYFADPPIVMDCIEFSKAFRTLDVADELAFFATECDMLGQREFGETVLRNSLRDLGDHPPESLIDFFRSYRACVRAKVAAERAQQKTSHRDNRTVVRYLQAADSYNAFQSGPSLIIVHGGIGTGKSTLAKAIADTLGFEQLSTDDIRREEYGPANTAGAYGQGIYSEPKRLHIYERMVARAQGWLRDGVSVVMDGSFQLAEAWRFCDELIRREGVSSLAIECTCSDQTAKERIRRRRAEGKSTSEAIPDFVGRSRHQPEAPSREIQRLTMSTTQPVETMVEAVIRHLC